MNKKLILTDCDGVLLDWETHYHRWMKMKGHKRASDDGSMYHQEQQYGLTTEQATATVDEFMSSAWVIGFPPLRDAVKGMARLADAASDPPAGIGGRCCSRYLHDHSRSAEQPPAAALWALPRRCRIYSDTLWPTTAQWLSPLNWSGMNSEC